ncbi:MAG: electron transport complex subunit RsxC [Christensenellales bacterium]
MAFTFRKGIHPKGSKERTENLPLETMPAPKTLYFPLSQHLGAPAEAAVKAGDKVKAGSLIGVTKGFVSANVYSSVSGEVKGIVTRKSAQGVMTPHIEIENDGEYSEALLEKLVNPSREQIIERIKQAGIVGMGGAAFPTHVKLTPSKPVDTLIINGAECEPYITCDYRLMLERAEEIIKGVKYLMKALNVSKAVIGIENNKPEAINKFLLMDAEGIEIAELKAKYPQGAEKQLIYAITKRKVPAGGLPMDIGAVVQNIHTAYAVYQAIEEGVPSHTRMVTVSGKAISKPANLIVRTGTTYADIYEYCKGDAKKECVKVISGGPMMGFAQADLTPSVTKGCSAILFLTREEVCLAKPSPCINCTACSHVCPMNLMPMFIDACAIAGDIDGVIKYKAANCIECGSCSFVCPAKRPLVQSIRLGKKMLKDKVVK